MCTTWETVLCTRSTAISKFYVFFFFSFETILLQTISGELDHPSRHILQRARPRVQVRAAAEGAAAAQQLSAEHPPRRRTLRSVGADVFVPHGHLTYWLWSCFDW